MLSRRSSCSPCRSLLSQDCCRNRARRATSRASTGWGSGRRSGSGGGGARGRGERRGRGPEGAWAAGGGARGRVGLPRGWGPRARACGRRHSQSSRMTLASMMTRAPRLMPAPPARSAAAPGRQAPSWPQRHTVTFRGCSRCWGGCPESWSSRLRRCSPSGTRSLGRRRAWLTAEGACGQAGAGGGRTPPCLCTRKQPTGWRSWHARPRFPHPSSASDNQSLPGLRVH